MLLVPPLLRIQRQMLGGLRGGFAYLECIVEAFPSPVNYWERHDGLIISPYDGKYGVNQIEYDIYKTKFTLNVTLERADDFGIYFCVSKNEKGMTKGGITLFGKSLFTFWSFFG